MTDLSLPESHADLLAQPLPAVLTTVMDDGQPQSTAVWFLVEDGVLKMSLATARQKYRNLVRDPRATLFVLDPTNQFHFVEVRATVEITPDPDKALMRKTVGHYGASFEDFDDPSEIRTAVTFHPTRIVVSG
jgi:PPOX class probable F420-dependent enzyme